MTYTYQPAPAGLWRSSPARRLLWATIQLRHRIERDEPEQPLVESWTETLAGLIAGPVLAYDWEGWHADNVTAKRLVVQGRGIEPARLVVVRADTTPPDEPIEQIAAQLGSVDAGAIAELHADAGATRADNLELPFDPGDLEAGVQSAGSMIAGIPDTIRTELQAEMRAALDAPGQSQFDFARAIRNAWPGVSTRRATIIAVTEWNRAASVATLAGYRRMGIEKKVWYTVGDRRVCPICEANASEGEIPIGRRFTSGDDSPPQHPVCRCNVSAA